MTYQIYEKIKAKQQMCSEYQQLTAQFATEYTTTFTQPQVPITLYTFTVKFAASFSVGFLFLSE